MNNNIIFLTLLALAVGAILGYLIAESNDVRKVDTFTQNQIPMGMHRMPDGTMMGNADKYSGMGMMGGMGMMMVSSEKEFLTEMIPHHQEAVDTAKQVLARGATTPEIKTLLQNIILAQEKEIVEMKLWYQTWYGTPYQLSNSYRLMMRDLTKLNGVELDKVFLEDMIMHHMGAIMMAHSVQGYIEHDEIKNLTKNIISTQSDEIVQMRKMRAGL